MLHNIILQESFLHRILLILSAAAKAPVLSPRFRGPSYQSPLPLSTPPDAQNYPKNRKIKKFNFFKKTIDISRFI